MVNKPLPDKSFTIEGTRLSAPLLEAGLYVVATPIGNLGDITLRALQVLAAGDLIACEDKRTSRVLLDRYGITTPLTSYHDHNGEQARPALLQAVADGQAVALISDAGTPLIADPGFKLVAEARASDLPVVAIPGPNAAIAALSIAGHPTDHFTFVGFLPSKPKARDDALSRQASLPGTLCYYEAPSRLASTLEAMAGTLGENRKTSVCRELTKRYETVRTAPLADLATHYANEETPRGEIVIVVAPAPHVAPTKEVLDQALRAALKDSRVKDAANSVAAQFNVPKRDMYQRALELVKHDGAQD